MVRKPGSAHSERRVRLRVERAVFAAMFGPGLATAAAGSLTLGALAGTRVLESGGVAPDPGTWLVITALGTAASLSLAVPLAAVVASVVGVSRLVDDGAWTGFRASGVSGRRLAGPALAVGLVVGLGTFGATGYVEPVLRRTAVDVWTHNVRVSLVPGVPVAVGGTVLIAAAALDGGGSDVFLASPRALGFARRAALRTTEAGPAIELVDGTFEGLEPRPWRLSFERMTRALPATVSPRVELDQRTTPELWAAIDRTEAAGRDARYERAVARKRWLHPLVSALLPAAALPFGARGRPWLAAGLVLVGWLVATRVGDAFARVLGDSGAFAAPCYAVFVGVVAWSTWRDR